MALHPQRVLQNSTYLGHYWLPSVSCPLVYAIEPP
jgi:hypothetical protein